MDVLNTVTSITRQLNELTALDENELGVLLDGHKKEYYNLLMATASLINKTCGNLNKVYEKTTELSLSIESSSSPHNNTNDIIDLTGETVASTNTVYVSHVKYSYGPDLIIHNPINETTTEAEVKTSVVKKKNSFKSNWMFKISVDRDKPIFPQIYGKYTGVVILNAVSGIDILKTYTLSGLFASLLFTRYMQDDSYNGTKDITINLGATYCTIHNVYHRIEVYLNYDKLLQERVKFAKSSLIQEQSDDNDAKTIDYMSFIKEDEWKDMFKKHRCSKKL
jgi:hypothetical protein